MNTPKDEIAKEEIKNQAQKLFKQFGLKKTTMDEIASACGKAKSTLYHYYSSKEEVFEAVVDREMLGLRRLVKEKVDTSTTIQKKLENYFVKFHEEIIDKINLYRIVKNEIKNQCLAEKLFKKIMKYEQDYLTHMLEEAHDSGEFNEFKKEDLSWYAEIMLAAFLGIVKYTIESEEGFDQQKLKRTAESLIPRIFN